LRAGDLESARHYLARIVSRDTGNLSEAEIVRALLETVAENISDGIVAPLFYLALGGPVLAMVYKAVNTMDSMVGYVNERYCHFGWFAARADDVANWIPARLSGLLLVAAAACCNLDWRGAWRIMRRDGRKMKSPNAGIPEAAAAGALAIRLGGPNVYFGQVVAKAYLGDAAKAPMLEAYGSMIRLMYATSLTALLLALGARFILAH
jgi:adenosylcobinamide-phosphate synthase